MTQLAAVRSWCRGITLLIFAAALHQSFATVAPPTTAQTTTAPHKGPERPERGEYNLTGSNGTMCFLAHMGLQLNITLTLVSQNKTVQEIVNINPNVTKSSGSCEGDTVVLQLVQDSNKANLTFVFTLNTTSNKYHLGEVSLMTPVPGMKDPFSAHNLSLDYMRASMGHSYMCREEQTLAVVSNFSINAFQMQIQPFGVVGNQFGAAEECQLDEDDMLIPIMVGAILAGLVIIVLFAYLIGRKRSHAGYQTI